jgi:hypothetical protein
MIDIVTKADLVFTPDTLDTIYQGMPGDFNTPSHKAIINSIARASVSFKDAFIKFKDKVHMHDLVKAYVEMGAEVDFNAPVPELVQDGIHLAAGAVGMPGQNTSLLAHIFGQHVNDRNHFAKLIKQLQKFEGIDWTGELFGSGRNILEQIVRFENMQQNRDALQLMKMVKEKYGLVFELNKFSLLRTLIDQISQTQDDQHTMEQIQKLGFNINRDLAILAYASVKNISLSDAAEVLNFMPAGQLGNIEDNDMRSVAGVIARYQNKTPEAMSANLKQLQKLGFNDWNRVVNDQTLLHMIINNCPERDDMHNFILAILKTKINWNFEAGAENNTALDRFLMNNSYVHPEYLVNLVKILKKSNIQDWVKVAAKIINSPKFLDGGTQRSKVIGELPEQIDFASEFAGRALLSLIAEKINAHVDLMEITSLLAGRGQLNEAGKQILFISGFQQHMLDFAMITHEFQNHGIKIDWHNLTHNGLVEKLATTPNRFLEELVNKFATVGVNHIDWTSIASSPESLQKMVFDAGWNIASNVRFLIQHAHQIDWYQLADRENNSVLLKARQNNIPLHDLSDLARMMNQLGLPLFNINAKNTANNRLIDLMRGDGDALIKLLRELGSVEPREAIVAQNINGIERLDLSNGRLDSYMPNQTNAPKILNALYAKFPLGNNGQMTEEVYMNQLIDAFKRGDFDGWMNTEWHDAGNPLTIPEVIDVLCAANMQAIGDRATLEGQYYYWGFKKVLASIIHAINTSGDQEGILRNNLINCLSELKMCHLGKLINLLNVVQDVVLTDVPQVNYEGTISPENQNVIGFFGEVLQEIQNHFANQDRSATALAKWFIDMKSGNVNQAHTWSAETQYIHSVMNRIFNNHFGEVGDKVESYHFATGLVGCIIIQVAVNILDREAVQHEGLRPWKAAIEGGRNLIIRDFFQKCLDAESIEAIEALFEGITENKQVLYGDFQTVNLDDIKECFVAIHKKQNGEKLSHKFIELLAENCSLRGDTNHGFGELHQTLDRFVVADDSHDHHCDALEILGLVGLDEVSV